MMKVVQVQALASVQDLGRFGLRGYGVGHCGAMDTLALQAGNLLVGNPENSPAVEIVLGGLTVVFERDTTFCLTGALYEAYLGEERIHSYWRYTARKGQSLQLVRAVQGMYGYLCVAGGFELPKVLGSCSTDLRAKFGGFEGRALQMGDQLPLGKGEILPSVGIAHIPFQNKIRVVPSSEFEAFTDEAKTAFFSRPYTLSSSSNRMGYRLTGEALNLIEPLEMLSHAVQFGTVQVPPNGQPIVLMADTQTTGGYPKIATVAYADLGRLAQIRLGSQLYFEPITAEQAVRLQQKNDVYLHQIERIANDIR